MMKRALFITTTVSLALVFAVGYIVQYVSLRYDATFYSVEYFVFLLLASAPLSIAEAEEYQIQEPFYLYLLRNFLPTFFGVLILSLVANIAIQIAIQIEGGFSVSFLSFLIPQIILHIYYILGWWLLQRILRRFLWKTSTPEISFRKFIIAILIAIVAALAHSICGYASLMQMLVTPNYSQVGLLYGAQQGVIFLVFMVAGALDSKIKP